MYTENSIKSAASCPTQWWRADTVDQSRQCGHRCFSSEHYFPKHSKSRMERVRCWSQVEITCEAPSPGSYGNSMWTCGTLLHTLQMVTYNIHGGGAGLNTHDSSYICSLWCSGVATGVTDGSNSSVCSPPMFEDNQQGRRFWWHS